MVESMIKAPEEVMKAIDSGNIGGRICHLKRADGTNCSNGKSSSMVITKRHTCWGYYCFRCKMYGEIPFDRNTPAQTLKLIAANRARKEMNLFGSSITLPRDFEVINGNNATAAARNWLWRYGIGLNLWKKYQIGWSNIYQRLIFPLRGDLKIKESVTLKDTLLGWVGRDVEFVKDENKMTVGSPKYLIRTKEDKERKYFTYNRKDAKTLVIVEDILSAIKVFEAVDNVNVMALLNSSINPLDVFTHYRRQAIKIWLDADMRKKSIGEVTRLSQFGFTVKHIYSFKDPKEHRYSDIKELLKPTLRLVG